MNLSLIEITIRTHTVNEEGLRNTKSDVKMLRSYKTVDELVVTNSVLEQRPSDYLIRAMVKSAQFDDYTVSDLMSATVNIYSNIDELELI